MPYPAIAYHQLFPSGQDVDAFDRAEDGDHYQPEPNFFEWWYFDAAFEDGSHLVSIFHSSLYNAVDHKPTLDLRYYPPQGEAPVVVLGRFGRDSYRSDSDRCWVKIHECLAADEGEDYRLVLHEGRLAAELVFQPCLPGWKVGTGHLFADSSAGHFFDWVIPLPCAQVEGTVSIDGNQQRVVGRGYHDHNWGNFYLPAAFQRWTWGRVLADDWTLIFGDLVGRGRVAPHVTPLIVAQDGEILVSTDCIRMGGSENSVRGRQPGIGSMPTLHMTTVYEPQVEIALTARHTMEALDFAAPHLFLARRPRLRGVAEGAFYVGQRLPIIGRVVGQLLGKGSYVRCLADCRLEVADYGIREMGQGLYEVMSF